MPNCIEILLTRDYPELRLQVGDRIRLFPGSHMETVHITDLDYQAAVKMLKSGGGVAIGEPITAEMVTAWVDQLEVKASHLLPDPPKPRLQLLG